MSKNLVYKSEEGRAQIMSFYERLLTDWHQPVKERMVETTYGKTYILENGEKTKPTLILLHGTGSNSAMWKADIAEYVKNYHVFSIDIIGECGKSEESRPKFSESSYAKWLNEIFESLAINKASLIACSLGGWIAIDFALTYPDKTDKLILIATAGITNIKAKTLIWIMVTSIFGKWGFNKINKLVYGDLEIDQTALEFASLIKENFYPRTDVIPVFSKKELNKLKLPILFFGGENDCFYDSKKTAVQLKNQTANSTTFILENTGHVVINQTQKILQFLSKN